MDVMNITQLSTHTGIDVDTLTSYRDHWLLYLPAIRLGQTIGFLPEAADVMHVIHTLTQSGASTEVIAEDLAERYPVSVVASQPIATPPSAASVAPASPVSGLLLDVDARYRSLVSELGQVREDLGKTASEERALHIQQLITGVARSTRKQLEPISTMSAELVQIRQAVGILASRVERQHTASLQTRSDLASTIDSLAANLPAQAPGITNELNAVRLELAELRSSLPEPTSSATAQLHHLTADITSLKDQISDLRRERGQMISLMSALQDNLAQLHIELADARTRTQQPPTLHVVDIVPQTGDLVEAGTGGLRTPRRLGHQTR
ncbi:MAG TPA: hypothetical protein PK691_08570 [Thermomicrobiales bacterium]|nr:hypothetical protein [Thermomicrobiales bacterium]HRA46745.1 hypothetical protein [Thermomicrobiales bacterium]